MKPDKPVRVRFAPSPTGFLHIGGIRSSLFNYLFAKKHHGTFILRLEDTDRERFVPEAEAHLVESLKWLGIGPDEGVGADKEGGHGPYIQSQRLELYGKRSADLVEKGSLYPCWCSPERLTELRQTAQAEHKAFKYDRYCLSNPGDLNQPHVLRFKMPDNQVVAWDDVVRDRIEFNTEDLDDFVAIKSDKFPTYQFANVVDDHEMEISHVLRADEWLPSTPKHILLYQAFGWEPPLFAHLPAVAPPGGGKKLSKRHGAKSALELRDEGYLPEAIVNFLALLGWNPGEGSTKEIFSLDELIEAFDLTRVQKSPAVFDAERLDWFNNQHIRKTDITKLISLSDNFWPIDFKIVDQEDKKWILRPQIERLKNLHQLSDTDFIDKNMVYLLKSYNPDISRERLENYFNKPNLNTSIACNYLKDAINIIVDIDLRKTGSDYQESPGIHNIQSDLFSEFFLRNWFKNTYTDSYIGPFFQTIRFVLSGRESSIDPFQIMAAIENEAVSKRLGEALNRLNHA